MGAAWLNSVFKLRASASRAYRLPTFTELYYSDPMDLGNPNLKPESATSYEAGMDAYLNKKLRASVTVFQRRDTNDIDYVKAPTDTVWVAENFDKLHFTGVEASTEYAPIAGQTIGLAFTALRGLSQNSELLESKYTFNYPVQSAVAQWRGALGTHVIGARASASSIGCNIIPTRCGTLRSAMRPAMCGLSAANQHHQRRLPGNSGGGHAFEGHCGRRGTRLRRI